MNNRYVDVTDDVRQMLEEVRDKYFPELVNAKIALFFDMKHRKSGGQMVLGRILRPNDLIRYLTADEREAPEGCDYIITLDKVCWDHIHKLDRIRLLRHELRHTYFDIEATSPYKLQNHTINDFHEEVELNKDDPRWMEKAASLTESIYEQQKEEREEKKSKKKR